MITMQYAKVLTKSNEEKSFMSAALLQGRDEESQLKNICKNLAAGDCIFLLTFNLLYMLGDLPGALSFIISISLGNSMKNQYLLKLY